MIDGKDWWVRPDNLIRLGQVPHGETAWECVYLKRDYDDARAEIASLRAKLAAVDLLSLIIDRAQMDAPGGAYLDAASLREILAAVGEGR
jgi:hypothetical protein